MSGAAVDVAVTLLIELIEHQQQIAQMIKAAKANNQTMLTQDQWDMIIASDKAARDALSRALAQR